MKMIFSIALASLIAIQAQAQSCSDCAAKSARGNPAQGSIERVAGLADELTINEKRLAQLEKELREFDGKDVEALLSTYRGALVWIEENGPNARTDRLLKGTAEKLALSGAFHLEALSVAAKISRETSQPQVAEKLEQRLVAVGILGMSGVSQKVDELVARLRAGTLQPANLQAELFALKGSALQNYNHRDLREDKYVGPHLKRLLRSGEAEQKPQREALLDEVIRLARERIEAKAKEEATPTPESPSRDPRRKKGALDD